MLAPGGSILREDRSGLTLTVPPGWSVVDDVGAVMCEAPARQADATGRTLGAQIRVEVLGETDALVPRYAPPGTATRPPGTSTRPPSTWDARGAGATAEVAARDVVDDALSTDHRAWLVDRRPWTVRSPDGRSVDGTRVDVAQHDMTTPLVVSTVVLETAAGLVRVTASVPVAHQRAVARSVAQALASIEVTAAPMAGRRDAAGPAPSPARYVPPVHELTSAELDVFVTGSHKIAARWRPGPVRAGLLTPDGVATPLGDYVRRAVGRPDARVHLALTGPAAADGTRPAFAMLMDRRDHHVVLRADLGRSVDVPGPLGRTLRSAVETLEVVDVAAAPARAAAWLGAGPGGTGVDGALPAGWSAVVSSAVAERVGARPTVTAVPLGYPGRPWDDWFRLLHALG